MKIGDLVEINTNVKFKSEWRSLSISKKDIDILRNRGPFKILSKYADIYINLDGTHKNDKFFWPTEMFRKIKRCSSCNHPLRKIKT